MRELVASGTPWGRARSSNVGNGHEVRARSAHPVTLIATKQGDQRDHAAYIARGSRGIRSGRAGLPEARLGCSLIHREASKQPPRDRKQREKSAAERKASAPTGRAGRAASAGFFAARGRSVGRGRARFGNEDGARFDGGERPSGARRRVGTGGVLGLIALLAGIAPTVDEVARLRPRRRAEGPRGTGLARHRPGDVVEGRPGGQGTPPVLRGADGPAPARERIRARE
jgi:hypothetical protein